MYKPTHLKLNTYLNPTTGEWDTDYQVISMNRDSDPLGESNFFVMEKIMEQKWYDYPGHEGMNKPFGIVRFRSAAVGWVDWIMLSTNAPDAYIKECNDIIQSLEENYGCLDEMDYSERESEYEL